MGIAPSPCCVLSPVMLYDYRNWLARSACVLKGICMPVRMLQSEREEDCEGSAGVSAEGRVYRRDEPRFSSAAQQLEPGLWIASCLSIAIVVVRRLAPLRLSLRLRTLVDLPLALGLSLLLLLVAAPTVVHVAQVGPAVVLVLAEASVDEVVQVAQVEARRRARRRLRRVLAQELLELGGALRREARVRVRREGERGGKDKPRRRGTTARRGRGTT